MLSKFDVSVGVVDKVTRKNSLENRWKIITNRWTCNQDRIENMNICNKNSWLPLQGESTGSSCPNKRKAMHKGFPSCILELEKFMLAKKVAFYVEVEKS